MSTYPSDLEIASAANKISIDKVAATIDITDKDLIKFVKKLFKEYLN